MLVEVCVVELCPPDFCEITMFVDDIIEDDCGRADDFLVCDDVFVSLCGDLSPDAPAVDEDDELDVDVAGGGGGGGGRGLSTNVAVAVAFDDASCGCVNAFFEFERATKFVIACVGGGGWGLLSAELFCFNPVELELIVVDVFVVEP